MGKVFKGRIILWLLLLVATAWIFYRFFPVAPEAVSRKPYDLFTAFSRFPITNAMVTNWVLALVVIFGMRFAVGKHPQIIPTRSQAVVEMLIEKLRTLFEPIVGKRVLPHVFPLLLTLFVYILIQNLSGLFPGVGAFGMEDSAGHFNYFFRPTNADLNATLGLALVSFFAWFYFVIRYAGAREFLHHTFGNKSDRKELSFGMYFSLGIIFLGVGVIDVISMLFRVVSLSFRLYGNIFGGENLLTSMLGLFAYFVPVPFYFLEMLIGFIQALVFTLLTAVYIGLITNHGESEAIS